MVIKILKMRIIIIIASILFCNKSLAQIDEVQMSVLEMDLKCFEEEILNMEELMIKDQVFDNYLKSESSNLLRPYQIKFNSDFIRSTLELYDIINEALTELQMINSISNPHFYNSLKLCDCLSLPKQIKYNYKDGYRILNNLISKMSVSNSIGDDKLIANILLNLSEVKRKNEAINSVEINKAVDDENLDDLIKYLSNDVVPNNSEKFRSLESSLYNLKDKVLSFIAITKFINI